MSKGRSVNKDWEFVSKGTEISVGKFVPEFFTSLTLNLQTGVVSTEDIDEIWEDIDEIWETAKEEAMEKVTSLVPDPTSTCEITCRVHQVSRSKVCSIAFCTSPACHQGLLMSMLIWSGGVHGKPHVTSCRADILLFKEVLSMMLDHRASCRRSQLLL